MLGFNSTPTLDKLAKQSSKFLDIFTKTVENLNGVNVQIEGEITAREEQVRSLEAEKTSLTGLKEANEKIVGKLRKILE